MRNVDEIAADLKDIECKRGSKRRVDLVQELIIVEEDIDNWWKNLSISRKQEICKAEREEKIK